MKTKFTTLFLVCLLLSINAQLFSQATGDFRSRVTGEWRTASSWERFSGGTWSPATEPPPGLSGVITIQAAHTITVGTGTDTIKINGASVIVNGYLKELGLILKTSGSWVINGTFELGHPPATNLGLPTATWNDGSTCLLTGIAGSTTSLNAVQSFFHLTINCPNWSANLNLGWIRNVVTVRGDVNVISTGSGRLQFGAPVADSSVVVNILGNLNVSAGQSATNLVSVTSNGTSNPYTSITVNVYGNVTVTGNPTNVEWTNFSISRGSQGNSGTATWNFYGNVSISSARIQNSTGTSAGGLGKFVFAKTGTQSLTLTNIYTTTAAAINIEVKGGTTLNIGSTTLTGSSGFFMLNPAATLQTSNIAGIEGNLTNTGDKTLSTQANYTFNGTASQITSILMPATVNNLTINNTAGVAMSQATTINGLLYLTVGVLDNCTHNVTVPLANIVTGSGSLLCAPNSVEIIDGIPQSFFVDQNYPNPFNPSTTIRFGLPAESFIIVKVFSILGQEVATLYEGRQNAGVHTLNFDATNLVSGVYFYRIQTDKSVDVKQMLLIK